MPAIELVYFRAGGGHRAAALALQAALRARHRSWQVRLVDLAQMLDPSDRFRRATGLSPEDLYNARLARGWTLGLGQELKLLQALIRLGHAAMTRSLRQHWLSSQPDMVVSVIPNFNRALCESLHAALPGRPYVTILTDLADHPPHFWIEPHLSQHLVCGTARAVEQARQARYPEERIHATSGMIIHPDFYRAPTLDRAAERRALGLPADASVGMVMFGGHGSNIMRSIARQLDEVPLILACGHNRSLARQLRAMKFSAPRVVVDFTPRIQYYMQLSDFLVGKPGPGTISEAVHERLPVIVIRNSWTMPQERYNTEWVRERATGLVLPNFRELRRAVSELTLRLPEFRARIAAIENRAVFEIPLILERIVQLARPLPRAPGQRARARTQRSTLRGQPQQWLAHAHQAAWRQA